MPPRTRSAAAVDAQSRGLPNVRTALAGRRPPLRLNVDVLTEIMSSLPTRKDRARMSSTCRALRAAAPKALLDGQVTLSHWNQFHSFYSFMFADSKRRFRYLRNLSFEFLLVHRNGPRLFALVAKLLKYATELEELRVLNSDLLGLDDTLRSSLSAVKRLRFLRLHSVDARTWDALAHLGSPLPEIDVSFYNYAGDIIDPLPFLAPFRDTLRTIAMSFVELSTADVLYDSVTALHISCCYYAELVVLERCFPKLRELAYEVSEDQELEDQQDEEIQQTRELNVDTASHSVWPSLRRASGTITSLYTLGLKCRIEYLDVAQTMMGTTEHRLRLRTILSDVRPTGLDLHIEVPGTTFSELVDTLLPARESLTLLTLAIDLHGHEYEDPSAQLSSLFDVLSTLELHALHLKLNWQRDPYFPAGASGRNANYWDVLLGINEGAAETGDTEYAEAGEEIEENEEGEGGEEYEEVGEAEDGRDDSGQDEDEPDDEPDEATVGKVHCLSGAKKASIEDLDCPHLAEQAARFLPTLRHFCVSGYRFDTRIFELQTGKKGHDLAQELPCSPHTLAIFGGSPTTERDD